MRRLTTAVVTLVLVAACGPSGTSAEALRGRRTDPAPQRRVATVVSRSATAPVAADAPPAFRSSARRLSRDVRRRMRGTSWRRGCPVALDDLRMVRVSHWTFRGEVRTGRLVVHRDVARDVIGVMRRLYEVRFPIRKMYPVDRYDADDDRSMAADNTSAFNCRTVAGTNRWSVHAYGRAIDVNPVENPYVRGSVVEPETGRRYVDRGRYRKGMIMRRGPVVKAFASAGWGWGGSWTSSKDYQHFSANGR